MSHNTHCLIILANTLYNFLDMSQPSVVCLNSLRSTDVGIVRARSAGVGIVDVSAVAEKPTEGGLLC